MTQAMMTVKRLDSRDSSSWALWPAFEQRATAFCGQYALNTPPEPMIRYVRKLFLETPELLGAWVVLDDTQQIRGHALGWVDTCWGVPYILIHQAWGDPPLKWTTFVWTILREVEAWQRSLNDLYVASGASARIADIRYMTERPDGWAGVLKGRVSRSLTMMTIRPEGGQTHGR